MEELDELIDRQQKRVEKLYELLNRKISTYGTMRIEAKIGCYRSFLHDLKLLKRDIEENKQNEMQTRKKGR